VKIALFVPGGVDRSGTERVIPCLLALIDRLVCRGHEVHVFAAAQEPKPGSWPLLGATVHNAGGRRRRVRMVGAFLREHRRGRFDVIHGLWAGMGAIGALASQFARVPMVLTLIGGDVVRFPDIGYGSQGSFLGRLMTGYATQSAVAITTESGAMSALAAKLGIAAMPVALGVDVQAWPVLAPRERAPGAPVRLLHVGSLNRVKDQPTLLRSLAILREAGVDFELEVVGVDTLSGAIHRLAAELGLENRVRFRGYLPHSRLREYFERADILVVSSIHEGAPVVMLEAAIAGVPTVGTQVGHVADFAPGAAVAVPVGDPASLAEAIRDLAGDEPRRLRLASAAQARARRIDADFTAETMLRLYSGESVTAA